MTEGIGAACNGAATSTSTYSSSSSSSSGSNKQHHHHGARILMTRRGGHGGHAAGAAGAGGGSLTTLGMSLPFFKIFLQLLLTGLNVACWLVPMKIKKFRENQELISLANAFSGGVFLSLAFGHMIPHSLEGFEAAGYAHNVPFLVVLTGYLMIFFIEKIAFDTHALIDHGHTHGHDAAAAPSAAAPAAAPAAVPAVTGGARSNGGKMIITAHGGHGGKAPATATATTVTSIITPPSSPAPQASGRSAVILLLALAVHSIFETMALGLSDTPLSAGLLALSIALHQPAESIALLVAFLKSGLSEGQTTRYLSLFSTVGTIGVILGLAVSSWASAVWDSIFVALTAGTFLYVGCTEIVAEEFEEEQGKWKKFGALLAGVVIVGAITTVTEGWEH
jgi:zinc transporter 1/2/3